MRKTVWFEIWFDWNLNLVIRFEIWFVESLNSLIWFVIWFNNFLAFWFDLRFDFNKYWSLDLAWDLIWFLKMWFGHSSHSSVSDRLTEVFFGLPNISTFKTLCQKNRLQLIGHVYFLFVKYSILCTCVSSVRPVQWNLCYKQCRHGLAGWGGASCGYSNYWT